MQTSLEVKLFQMYYKKAQIFEQNGISNFLEEMVYKNIMAIYSSAILVNAKWNDSKDF